MGRLGPTGGGLSAGGPSLWTLPALQTPLACQPWPVHAAGVQGAEALPEHAVGFGVVDTCSRGAAHARPTLMALVVLSGGDPGGEKSTQHQAYLFCSRT